MTETIDKNKELIEILLNTDNRDLAERVLKELQGTPKMAQRVPNVANDTPMPMHVPSTI